jgi:hypothetical protein
MDRELQTRLLEGLAQNQHLSRTVLERWLSPGVGGVLDALEAANEGMRYLQNAIPAFAPYVDPPAGDGLQDVQAINAALLELNMLPRSRGVALEATAAAVEVTDAVRDMVDRWVSLARDSVPDDALERDSGLSPTLRTGQVVLSMLGARAAESAAAAAASSASKAAEDAGTAASRAGEAEVGEEFRRIAGRERRRANWLQGAVLAVAAASVGWTLVVAGGGIDSTSELGKLAIVIPAAALAGYFGRESSVARTHATWAETIEVQLRSVEAYCHGVSNQDARELRALLGQRVFGSTGPTAGGDETSMPETLALVKQVLDVTKGAAEAAPRS